MRLMPLYAAVLHFDEAVDDGCGFKRVRGHDDRDGELSGGAAQEIEDKIAAPNPEPPRGIFGRRKNVPNGTASVATMLLHYTYSISGVTYETAQDITGMEQRAALNRAVVGKAASVKYDPSNPSNSILIAEDWSGLH